MFRRIDPAHVEPDATGAPFSARFGDVYASRAGALAQSRHVFLAGNDLPQRWQGRDQFVILETGFGLGVNFLAAWQAWRGDTRRPRRLHVVSIEKHPVDADTLLHWAPDDVAPLARELAAAWPLPLAGLHRLEFEAGHVVLTLAFGDIDDLLPQLVAGVDAFFLDGFAPDRNPAMWSPAVMKGLARLARTDATLATWSAARAVRETLHDAGFDVTRTEGFAGKREMLRARFSPRWRVRRHEPPAAWQGERNAMVIGAGLAGAHAAHALAQRGWSVTVLERGAHAAAGASGLPWGLLHAMVSADDSGATRLVRAGFLLAQSLLSRDPALRTDAIRRPQATLVQAADDNEAALWRAAADAMQLPPRYARFVERDAATDLLGIAPRQGGWWFDAALAVASSALCTTLVEAPGITLRRAAPVLRIERAGEHWIAIGQDGRPIAAALVCIVAGAIDAPALLGTRHAPVHRIRGQVSWFDAPALADLRGAITGGGTLWHVDAQTVGVGASYEIEPDDRPVDVDAAHRGNLQRLQRLVTAPVDVVPRGLFDGVRCAARDRLPLVGAVADETAAFDTNRVPRGAHLADLPRRAGLYASFGFGSRGLVLSPLAAQLIAAQIEGEPWPVELDLARQVDGARFLLAAVRRRRT